MIDKVTAAKAVARQRKAGRIDEDAQVELTLLIRNMRLSDLDLVEEDASDSFILNYLRAIQESDSISRAESSREKCESSGRKGMQGNEDIFAKLSKPTTKVLVAEGGFFNARRGERGTLKHSMASHSVCGSIRRLSTTQVRFKAVTALQNQHCLVNLLACITRYAKATDPPTEEKPPPSGLCFTWRGPIVSEAQEDVDLLYKNVQVFKTSRHLRTLSNNSLLSDDSGSCVTTESSKTGGEKTVT